jgi:hypothetical protein
MKTIIGTKLRLLQNRAKTIMEDLFNEKIQTCLLKQYNMGPFINRRESFYLKEK